MCKILLLLMLLSIVSWADRWTQIMGGYDGAKNSDSVLSFRALSSFSYLYFDSTRLTFFETSTDFVGNVGFFFNNNFYGPYCDLLSLNASEECVLRMVAYAGGNMGDSLWIQKNRNEFVFNDALDLRDTNLFVVPTMAEVSEGVFWEGYEGTLLDGYSLADSSLLDSVFFVYKRDSSYYAYCLYVQSEKCLSFLFQCEFKDGESATFEPFEMVEYPYAFHYIRNSLGGNCLTQSEYEKYLSVLPVRSTERSEPKASVPYLVNGTRSRGGASSVVIRNGLPKLELRK